MDCDLVIKQVLSYCTDRDAIFGVCKAWRKNYLFVNPMQTYINALQCRNVPLASLMWEYFSDRISTCPEYWKSAFYWSCVRGLISNVVSFPLFNVNIDEVLLNAALRCALVFNETQVVLYLLQDRLNLIHFSRDFKNPYNVFVSKKFIHYVDDDVLTCAVNSQNIALVGLVLHFFGDREDFSRVEGFINSGYQDTFHIQEYLLLSSSGIEFACDMSEFAFSSVNETVINALFICFDRDKTLDLDFLLGDISSAADEFENVHGISCREISCRIWQICARYPRFPMHLFGRSEFLILCEFCTDICTIERAYNESEDDMFSYICSGLRCAVNAGNSVALSFFLDHELPVEIIEEHIAGFKQKVQCYHSTKLRNLLELMLLKAQGRNVKRRLT
jgi:hypothetical protein